jgi:CspA family cold shock protein
MSEREQGTVKWFDGAKGYGFITREDGSEIFVHYSGIDSEGYRDLEENWKVSFEVEDTPKGPQAVRVQVLDLPAAL